MTNPTLRQLEYFVSVADEGSFHAAARACGVSQPGLSGQLRQLETQLDVQLFERDRRRVRLTAEGATLLPRARTILGHTRELVEAATALRQPLGGALRLGVIPTIARYLLPRVYGPVLENFPDVHIDLIEARTDELLTLLGRGDLDLLILALEVELGNVETLPLFRDEFYAVVPSGHRLARRKTLREDQLSDERLLLLDDGHCLRDQVWAVCERHGGQRADGFRASSLGTICQLVAAGDGITLVPELALDVEANHPNLRALRFAAPRPHRTIGLVWRTTSARAEGYTALGEIIREYGAGAMRA